MAEQNILSGNQKQLEVIIGDIRQYNGNKERLDRLDDSMKTLSKEIESLEKDKQGEIDSKVKASTEAICAGYNKAIESDKEKIKSIQVERGKAKLAGVQERIQAETASLREENADLTEQINEAFVNENISKKCNGQLFISMFLPNKVLDYCIEITFLGVMLVLVPLLLFFIPVIPNWVLLVYEILMSLVFVIVNKYVYRRVIIPHADTILSAQATREKIILNKGKISKITKNIKEDQNEDMYDLGGFDKDIGDVEENIVKTESQKKAALDEFDATTKIDILEEIDGRYVDKLEKLKIELSKKQSEYTQMDDLVKKQRIYISSNYEPYLGKELINVDKLTELKSIMKSGSADTISQALAVYKNRH